jgi:hypothetical protein
MAAVTRFPMRLFRLAATALALASACGSTPEMLPPQTTPRTVVPASLTLLLRPGQSGSAAYTVLGPTNAPLAGATVSFALVDNPDTPGQDAQGATLLSLEATTNAQGVAEAGILAGMPTTFTLRATSADAEVDVTVFVANKAASVAVAPFMVDPMGRAAKLNTPFEVRVYNKLRCADLPLRSPPGTVIPKVTVSPGNVARYKYVDTTISHSIIARAMQDEHRVLGVGCVDVPAGQTLRDDVQLAVPVIDISPDPVGTYTATTELGIAPPLAAAGQIAAVWRDLTDCPLDPAQRWLDCTIDALGPTSDADPLDCVPATTPGGDGALGDALGALRGEALTGPDGKPTGCRGSKTDQGALSADGLVQGLFGSPLPQPIVRLEQAADDAAHLFDTMTLTSRLDIAAGAKPSAVSVTHTLTDLTFILPAESGAVPPSADVALQPLGLPALSATTTGTIEGDVLDLAQHGFTLRLGSAAELGFGRAALASRALPPTAHGLVTSLAALAHTEDAALTGCAAMDAELCPRVGRSPGCLVVACGSGLDALATRLARSFEAADGVSLDFYLAGSGPLLDTHGNGLADKVGELPATRTAPAPMSGGWTVDLRPRGGRRSVTARWQADRIK